MADGRMLRTTIARDGRVAQLSVHSALLYVASIPHLDREGRMDGNPVAVRGTVVPALAAAHPDEWTDRLVASYITEWTGTTDEDSGLPRPLVAHYCASGVWVCAFVGFEKNQRLRWDRERPSSLPQPPPMLLERPHDDDAGDADSPGPDADSGNSPPEELRQPPGSRRAQAEAEAQGEVEPAEQRRAFARAREWGADPAALPDSDIPKDPLAAEILAGVRRREQGLGTHGALGRLLAVLTDADDNTASVMHALFDPLGERAIDHACREILAYQPRSPSRYAHGIARKWAGNRGAV